jgi:two-component system NtrC family response regulator/two-component system response regulator AtoC
MKTTASILIVDDDETFRGVLASELERMDFAVRAAGSGEEALGLLAGVEPDVILLDLRLPGMSGLETLKAVAQRTPRPDVIMLTGHGSIDTAMDAVRLGAFDVIAKPCPLDELEVRIRRALERQALRSRATLLERGLTPPDLGAEFIGRSPAFAALVGLIDRVAPTNSTALILGETGTGKEMVAKLIHARSARRAKPFVTVECAALQESLLQSELFGHERGAFTGADRMKPGLFEVAHGGTLFLDEIGEVSLATQVTLLRVLDAGTFRRVGGTAAIRVDVRIIAATNRDLPEMVRQGLFREDLFYRLSTLTLRVPPLRERRDDVELLVRHFVDLVSRRFGVTRRMDLGALAAFQRHQWPGNVRELVHAVEAAMIVCDGPELQAPHVARVLNGRVAATAPDEHGVSTLRECERAQIARALEATEGKRAQAARLLGISERNLYRKIRAHRLDGAV